MANSKQGQALLPVTSSSSSLATGYRNGLRVGTYLPSLDSKQPYTCFKELLGLLVVALVVYALLVLAIGDPFLPSDGAMWGLCLIWFCSHIGGYLVTKVQLPPSLGMLLAGFMLENIGTYPIRGLPLEWKTRLQVAGFAYALAHSSLACSDTKVMRQRKLAVMSLWLLPMLAEVAVTAAVFGVLFQMPPLLALAGGFALSGTAIEVVAAAMTRLGRKGYGLTLDLAPLLGQAAGQGVVISAAFLALFAGLAYKHGRTAQDRASLPISLALGAGGGLAGALISGSTVFWRTALQRAGAFVLSCQALMFLGLHIEDIGAGAGGVLLCGLLTSHFWAHAPLRLLSQPVPDEDQRRAEVDALISKVWRLGAQPLLFGCAGAAVSASLLPEHTMIKALLLVCVGLAARVFFTVLALLRSAFLWPEVFFIALTSVAKGAQQAALAAIPLDIILHHQAYAGDALQQWLSWGRQITAASFLSIIIGGPVCAVIARFLGPTCLEQEEEALHHTQAFGRPDNTSPASSLQSEPHLPQPKRPAPAVPGPAHSLSSQGTGNPFLEIELSTPRSPLTKPPKTAPHTITAAHVRLPLSSLPLNAFPGPSKLKPGGAADSAVPPPNDSYAAMMSPSESPSAGMGSIGAVRGAAGGNPFSALGNAGRALAAKFNTYKPMRGSSMDRTSLTGVEETRAMLQATRQPLYHDSSMSVEVELLASPRESGDHVLGHRSFQAAAAESQHEQGQLTADAHASQQPTALQTHSMQLQNGETADYTSDDADVRQAYDQPYVPGQNAQHSGDRESFAAFSGVPIEAQESIPNRAANPFFGRDSLFEAQPLAGQGSIPNRQANPFFSRESIVEISPSASAQESFAPTHADSSQHPEPVRQTVRRDSIPNRLGNPLYGQDSIPKQTSVMLAGQDSISVRFGNPMYGQESLAANASFQHELVDTELLEADTQPAGAYWHTAKRDSIPNRARNPIYGQSSVPKRSSVMLTAQDSVPSRYSNPFFGQEFLPTNVDLDSPDEQAPPPAAHTRSRGSHLSPPSSLVLPEHSGQALEFSVSPTFELQELDSPASLLYYSEGQSLEAGSRHASRLGSLESPLGRRRSVRFSLPGETYEEGMAAMDLSELPVPVSPGRITPRPQAEAHAHANPHVEAGLSSPPSPRVLRSTTSLQRKHAHPQAHAPAQAQGQALAATGNVQPERRTWSRQLSGIVPLTRFGRSDADRTMAALHGASQALQEHANSMPAPDEVASSQAEQPLRPLPYLGYDAHDLGIAGGSASASPIPAEESQQSSYRMSLEQQSPRNQKLLHLASLSTEPSYDDIDTRASTPKSRLSHPVMEQAPESSGTSSQVSIKSRSNSTSWGEAKLAAKRRSYELDKPRLIPPELERARHAHEDVDTPAVSPRAVSSRHSSFGAADFT